MKLKELKNLIEGCHPEDLNNDVEAVVISKKNKVFKSDSIRLDTCLLYTSPSPRDATLSRMPSSA